MASITSQSSNQIPSSLKVKDILVVEPFYCGSHKQLVDCLMGDPDIAPRCHLITMSGKKWHWRARVSALHLSTSIPAASQHFRVLFSSSVLNLAELVALRPDLSHLRKVVYFHENQLQYPVRKQQDRDFQYGYNQILSCLMADKVLFNSKFNMESFLCSINSFLKLMPDYRPKGLAEIIRPKCSVVYFPIASSSEKSVHYSCGEEIRACSTNADSMVEASSLCSTRADIEETSSICGTNTDTSNSGRCTSAARSGDAISEEIMVSTLSKLDSEHAEDNTHLLRQENQGKRGEDTVHSGKDALEFAASEGDTRLDSQKTAGKERQLALPQSNCLHIVWPHRWEHDKDPDTFFHTLFRLHDEGLQFKVSVLGETFTDVPGIFAEAKESLKDHIHAWGYQTDKSAYLSVLRDADVVVSTAKHEFFGVAMLEAVREGCYPLCPKALVYPEIYPGECLFSTSTQLYKRLRAFCRHPHLTKTSAVKIDMDQFSWEKLRYQYLTYLCVDL